LDEKEKNFIPKLFTVDFSKSGKNYQKIFANYLNQFVSKAARDPEWKTGTALKEKTFGKSL